MKKLRNIATILMGLLCLGVLVGCRSNERFSNKRKGKDNKEQTIYEQEFTLINETGTEFNNLYISPSGEEKWGSDVLTTDKLLSGSKADIVFSTGEKVQYWDLKAIDTKGKEILWKDIDLFTVSEITLELEGLIPIISIK